MDLPDRVPALPPRLTMRAFWRELADGVFDLERGLPWTFWRLLIAPGALIRDFVVHRDARIVRPVRWFLIGFAALAVVWQAIGAVDGFRDGITEGAQAAEATAAQIEMILWVFSQVQWLLLVSVVPAGAAALCRAYRVDRPEFAEMWVFCLYLTGQAMLLTAIAFALYAVPLLNLGILAIPVLLPVHFLAACAGYFRHVRRGRWWRPFAALALATVLTALFLLVGVVVASIAARYVG